MIFHRYVIEKLQFSRERTILSLIIPSFYPSQGTKCVVILPEILAGLVFFTTFVDTTIVIYIILPAIPKNEKKVVTVAANYLGPIQKLQKN